MDENKPMETCTRCKKTYENDGFVFVCPHCRQPRWGEIITFLVVAVLCIWVFLKVSPNMNPGFWRGVVRWVTAIFGFSSSIAVVVAFFQLLFGTKVHETPGTNVPLTPPYQPAVSQAPQPAAHQEPAAPSIEIDQFTIIDAFREKDYDRLTRMLYKLDRRTDREYVEDRAAFDHTCGLIQQIGEGLHRHGGEDLMKQVLTRAGSMGANTRFVERLWNGIGSWMG